MDFRALAMGLVFAMIWSSAFTSGRIIVDAAPPLSALSLRFYLSGAIAIAIAWWMGQSMRLTRRQWVSVLVFGICQNGLYLGLTFIALQTIEASLAAIIASAMPLMVAAANWGVFRERLPAIGVFGLAAGFAGVALIMTQRFSGGADPFGVLMAMIGALALSVATLMVRGASSGGGNLFMVLGMQLMVGGVFLTPPALVLETWQVAWSTPLVVAFVYTTLMPGLVATFIWFRLVDRIGATKAATYHFLNPFFGVAIAAALLSEALTFSDMIGVTIIAAGILMVQLARAKP